MKHTNLPVVNASEASIIGVGSGGSFTVASLLCTLHEAYTGRVSRPSTPLEIISNPTLASASPIFFVSAEGKNPDIVEALQRARRHSARDLHVLTNRRLSPLQDTLATLTDVNIHTFELDHKDGYLSTNSLILDAVVVARAYEELDRHDHIPKTIDDLTLNSQSISVWLERRRRLCAEGGRPSRCDRFTFVGAQACCRRPRVQAIGGGVAALPSRRFKVFCPWPPFLAYRTLLATM